MIISCLVGRFRWRSWIIVEYKQANEQRLKFWPIMGKQLKSKWAFRLRNKVVRNIEFGIMKWWVIDWEWSFEL